MKHVNPYREGKQYHAGFAFIQKKRIVTRSALVDFLQKKFDLKESAAVATATVLLSPREKNSKRGDRRGNLSAMGHIYFVQPLNKVKGQEKSFRLRWREKELPRRDYERPCVVKARKSVKQEKSTPRKASPRKIKTPVDPVTVAETPVAPVETVATVAPVETAAVVEANAQA